MYILKFKDNECWIAPWEGDPGRTLIKNSAKLFYTKEKAEIFKRKILKKNSHRNFDLLIEKL